MKSIAKTGVLVAIAIISAGIFTSCSNCKHDESAVHHDEDIYYGFHYDQVQNSPMFVVVNDSIARHFHFKNIIYKLDTSVNRYFVVK